MVGRLAAAVLTVAFVSVVAGLDRPQASSGARAQAAAKVEFARDIQPLFQQHCVGCHGPSQQINGLRLDRRRDAMRGSSALGVVIRPGNGAISPIYLKVTGTTFGTQMPPTGALKAEQIALLKQWIDEGAEWPDVLAGDVAPAPPDAGANRLIAAIRGRERGAVTRAMAADAVSINRRGTGGATALMWASLERDVEAVRALIAAGADPNLANETGATALMWAIPDETIVALLLARSADPNAKTLDGRTPLLRAAGIHGASTVVRRLLDAGAAPSTKGSSLFGAVSALTEAAVAADAATIQLLLSRGMNPAVDGPAPLVFALRANCAACEEALSKDLPPPLLSAAAMLHMPPNDNGRHLQRLLERGVDVTARDPEGRTLLMLAASTDTLPLDAVRTLIAKGADLGAQAKNGHTALDYAALRGKTPVVAALIDAGARGPAALPAVAAPSRAASARDAVLRSLPLLQRSDVAFWKKAGCISCHNNTLTAETVATARTRAVSIDEAIARQQRATIAGYLEAWRERALQGIGIPGDADTVSYILLGLAAEGHPPDQATDAMARFLLDKQAADGQWLLLAHRPPIESSVIEVTASSMRALQVYGRRHSADADRAIRRAAAWIARAPADSHEDRAFKLRGLLWAGTNGDAVQAAVRAIKAAQQPDGGWSQLASMTSDAYATGQALVAMAEAGVPRTDPSRRRGAEFLLSTQRADGSWFVRTRALPIQPYFEADFPYGRDQFISAAATNWATRALLLDQP